jgi:hypothetical protein
MRLTHSRLDLTYEHMFARPAFDLGRGGVDLVAGLYRSLSERFPLSLSDLVVSAGATLADLVVRVSLFRGQGTVEVRADRLMARFEGLQRSEDVAVVKEAVTLAEAGVAPCLPGLSYRGATVRTSTWVRCEGGGDAVRDLLQAHGEAGFPLDAGALGAQTVAYSLGARLSSETDQWTADFLLERSAVQTYDLFYALGVNYSEEGRYGDLEARSGHLEALYAAILGRFGLAFSATDG